MEDSFRVRVDKIFGSLGSETASSSISPSLWCLTDQEIERRQWNRNKEEEEEEEEEEEDVESGLSDLGNQGESDPQHLSDYEEEGIDGEKKKMKRVGIVDEDWDVESNIGRDCTLDYEEEEDEYDKVAAGTERSGDRLYMKDVKFADYETHELNTYGELPKSYQAVVRDPRANHMAAKIRLKEDAKAAGDFDTLQLSDNSGHLKRGDVDDVDNPKPILKKREAPMDCRSQKRVRFMFDDCEKQQQPLGPANDLASESSSCSRDGAVPQQASKHSYDVPDYVKNPSKYTHYTFDSSTDDMDDQSNQKAFTDLFHHLRERNTDNSYDSNVAIPKSIVFTPKRKPEDDYSTPKCCDVNSEGNLKKKGWSIGVVTTEDAMEEDEPPCLPAIKGQKPDRQYRARTNSNVEDNNLGLDVD